MVEEMEIKIEYIDSNEIDPLKEDVFQVSELTVESDKESQIITWFDSIDSDGRLLCKFCELRYSTTQTLRRHVTTKHMNKAVVLSKRILKNKRICKNVCHVCKRRLASVMDLKEHLNNSHSIEALSLSCLFCDATFNNSEELTNHMHLIHNKICNIYTCDICGYRTIKKSHFIKHSTTHIIEKSILCNYCDYATNNLENFKVHERVHTNYKPYVCNFKGCDYRSVAKSGLKSHQLKHFPELNMLFCDKCSYSTVYNQSLVKHIDSHKRITMRKFL